MKTIIIIISLISIHAFYRPVDYRDSYTGNYVCQEINRHLNSGYNFVQNTSNYTIIVNKSEEDSMLILTTREGNLNVKLVNNNFKNPLGKHCSGKFSGDSIYVLNVPSSAPNSYNYRGRK